MCQSLSVSLGQMEALLIKHGLGTLFWCFLKKHKAHLGALFFFFWLKKNMNHYNYLLYPEGLTWTLIYYTKIVLRCCNTQTIFCLHIKRDEHG